MKKQKTAILVLIVVILVLIAAIFVGIKIKSEHTLSSHEQSSISSSEQDPFRENGTAIERVPGSSNYITADVITPNPENMTLTYNGSPVLVTYQFQCEKPCTMGLMIFVNGILQPYTVVSTGEETTMHSVEMSEKDTQQFQFEFTPVCGKSGDELVVIFANVYNAKVMELSGDVNTFGNNHKISQPQSWTLKLNADSENMDFGISNDFKTKEFSAEDKSNFIKTDLNGNRRDQLDNCCYIEIRQKGVLLDSQATMSQSSGNNLELYIYGNLTGKYRISLYGDFSRIPINGYDYIEVDVKKGEYTVVPFIFSADDAKKYKNVFAVLAPTEFENSLSKSPSIYIKNK